MARRRHPAAIAAVVLALLFVGATAPAPAADDPAAAKLPRFASLHADKVNLRTGPGRQYPIEWVLTKKDMPVEIVARFEHWRRIREWDGTKGWVQEHMVSAKRYVIVARRDGQGGGNSGVRPLRSAPDPSAALVARVEPGVVARLEQCRGQWCRVEAAGFDGWMRRADLWGVFPDESGP